MIIKYDLQLIKGIVFGAEISSANQLIISLGILGIVFEVDRY